MPLPGVQRVIKDTHCIPSKGWVDAMEKEKAAKEFAHVKTKVEFIDKEDDENAN